MRFFGETLSTPNAFTFTTLLSTFTSSEVAAREILPQRAVSSQSLESAVSPRQLVTSPTPPTADINPLSNPHRHRRTINYSPSNLPSNPPYTPSPTTSLSPTYPPSTAIPTTHPSITPTTSPVIPPTAAPSKNDTWTSEHYYSQSLEIETFAKFTKLEVGIFQLQMQEYSKFFGHGVVEGLEGMEEGFIVTECEVIRQSLRQVDDDGYYGNGVGNDDDGGAIGTTLEDDVMASFESSSLLRGSQNHPNEDTNTNAFNGGDRSMQAITPPAYFVDLKFHMKWHTRYGYDISDYPDLFLEYLNYNLTSVVEDFQMKYLLNVLNAGEASVLETFNVSNLPTYYPTVKVETIVPTVPSTTIQTLEPSLSLDNIFDANSVSAFGIVEASGGDVDDMDSSFGSSENTNDDNNVVLGGVDCIFPNCPNATEEDLANRKISPSPTMLNPGSNLAGTTPGIGSKSNDDSNNNYGLIIGSICAVVVAISSMAILLWIRCRRKSNSNGKPTQQKSVPPDSSPSMIPNSPAASALTSTSTEPPTTHKKCKSEPWITLLKLDPEHVQLDEIQSHNRTSGDFLCLMQEQDQFEPGKSLLVHSVTCDLPTASSKIAMSHKKNKSEPLIAGNRVIMSSLLGEDEEIDILNTNSHTYGNLASAGNFASSGQIPDSITVDSNPPLMMIASREDSFSSGAEYLHSPSDAEDEFDSYKNHDLEVLRKGVLKTVADSEGMISLAMTKALIECNETDMCAEEDPSSIEANCLYETNDWMRKNQHSDLDYRNDFFQEILDKMVVTVRSGMMRPQDASRAVHGCAAILGLNLVMDHSQSITKTILIQGMRKVSDLPHGRRYLVLAFTRFGEVEDAAIAPCNRGFGFVRFVHSKSAQHALDMHRMKEIEVQDVSVMIKTLQCETLSNHSQ